MDSNATPAQIGVVFFIATATTAVAVGLLLGAAFNKQRTGYWFKKPHHLPGNAIQSLMDYADQK